MINFAPPTATDAILPGANVRTRARRRRSLTSRRARAEQASPSPAALIKALDMVRDAVFLLDVDSQIVAANAAAAALTCYPAERLRGLGFAALIDDAAEATLREGLAGALRGELTEEPILANLRTADGGLIAARVQIDFVCHEGQRLPVVLVQPPGAEHRIDAPHHRDYLTDLPTRADLVRRLQTAERRAVQNFARFAVLFIDADGFKVVNDVHGHSTGDVVLRTLGQRLRACMRPGDFVARYGGDEFVAVVEGIRSAREVARIAKRIRQELNLAIEIAGHKLQVSVSIGTAIGDASATGQQVLDAADRAMYRAKARHRAKAINAPTGTILD